MFILIWKQKFEIWKTNLKVTNFPLNNSLYIYRIYICLQDEKGVKIDRQATYKQTKTRGRANILYKSLLQSSYNENIRQCLRCFQLEHDSERNLNTEALS